MFIDLQIVRIKCFCFEIIFFKEFDRYKPIVKLITNRQRTELRVKIKKI